MNLKSIINKSSVIQMSLGVLAWIVLTKKTKKTVLMVGGLEPLLPDYVSQFFKDEEYFGVNKIPKDYYGNWLKLAEQLDKIRVAYGLPIIIKKGFTIKEEFFNTCLAVEIYPQNNDIDRLKTVLKFIDKELTYEILEQKDNKNIYIKV